MEGRPSLNEDQKLSAYTPAPAMQKLGTSTNLNPVYPVIQAWDSAQCDQSENRDFIAPETVPMAFSDGENRHIGPSAAEGKPLDTASFPTDDRSSAQENVDVLQSSESQRSTTIHEYWTNFIQSYVNKVEEDFSYMKSVFTEFANHPASTHPNSKEYREAALRMIDTMLAQSQQSTQLYGQLRDCFGQWDASYPRDVLCSICAQEKTPSCLSCPRKDVLCLECAGKRYMSNDLRCLCGLPWSREQCQGLHDALSAAHMYDMLPAESLHPIDEVECLHCHRFIGEAALDPYICSKSHNICKKCATDLDQICPACQAEHVS